MKDFNRQILDIKPSGIRKFFDIVAEMKDAISLGVGEPDFDTPWHIREEGIHSLEQGKTFYTSNSGLMELRKYICLNIEKKYGVHYDPKSEAMVTVGGSEAIDIAMRVLLNPGDEVIIPEPCYVSYVPCCLMAGGKPVICELTEEDEFRLTGEKLLKCVTDNTKILVLPFPNNPTGAVLTDRELSEIAEIAREKDFYILSDEIYSDLTYGMKPRSIIEYPGMRDRVIYINGFSKAYAMTGWRLGYCLAAENILKQMLKLHQFAIMCAPTVSQYAAVEAVKNGEADICEMRNAYDQRRKYLVGRLNAMGMDCFEPFGAFYVFPSIRRFNMTSEEFAERLLKEYKVAIVPGTAFGASGEGYMRISYAYSIEDLKRAIDRIEEFVKRL